MFMGKFPEADYEFNKVLICQKCKARNPATAKRCRRCGSTDLRPKRKIMKKK
jgi:large subunit ribosomal protein L40e